MTGNNCCCCCYFMSVEDKRYLFGGPRRKQARVQNVKAISTYLGKLSAQFRACVVTSGLSMEIVPMADSSGIYDSGALSETDEEGHKHHKRG